MDAVADICPVCCESYNKSAHKAVACPGCAYAACRSCVQRYILDSDNVSDPSCMSCKRPWLHQFLADNMPRTTFIEGAYKKKREEVLFERERSYLPATQQEIMRDLRAEEIDREVAQVHERIQELHEHIAVLEVRKNRVLSGLPEMGGDDEAGGARGARGTRAAANFVRACPGEGCRGFLGANWRCGLCQLHVCKHCHDKLPDGAEDGGEDGGTHVCDPNAVATARLLARDTKPCPNCHSMIFKIDGCFGKDTPVLLWDGRVKMSQDIAVGDVLVGDDGTQRTVQSLCHGEDELFRVDQDNGMSYVVNSRHTLVLRSGSDAEVVTVVVADYMRMSPAERAGLHGYRALPGEPVLLTAISVEPLGRGAYWGWEVDCNHRFVTPDFTIVKNCDQMYCTQCHVAFSWRTGDIVRNGRVHNPHYFDYLRQQNGGVIRREVGDEPGGGAAAGGGAAEAGGCDAGDRLPTVWNLRNAMRACQVRGIVLGDADVSRFWSVYRCLLHVQDVELVRYPAARPVDLRANMDIRKQYLRGQLSEEAFKARLQQREKKRAKCDEVGQVLSTLVQVGSERVQALMQFMQLAAQRPAAAGAHPAGARNALVKQLQACVDALEQLRVYVNTSLQAVGKRFNNKVPHIVEDWSVTTV